MFNVAASPTLCAFFISFSVSLQKKSCQSGCSSQKKREHLRSRIHIDEPVRVLHQSRVDEHKGKPSTTIVKVKPFDLRFNAIGPSDIQNSQLD